MPILSIVGRQVGISRRTRALWLDHQILSKNYAAIVPYKLAKNTMKCIETVLPKARLQEVPAFCDFWGLLLVQNPKMGQIVFKSPLFEPLLLKL